MGSSFVINIGAGTVIGARAYGPGAKAEGSVTVSPSGVTTAEHVFPNTRPKRASQGRTCEGSGKAPIPCRVAYFHEGREVSLEESDALYDQGIWTEPQVLEDPGSDKYCCPFCKGSMGKDGGPMHAHRRDYKLVLR